MTRGTPTVVGFAVAAAASGNSITFNKSDLPTMANGDYLVAVIRGSTSAVTGDNACTGFARIGATFPTIDASGRLIGFYGHLAATATSEPSTYTFTYTGTGGRIAGILLLVRGVDTTTPVGFSPNTPTYYSATTWTTTVGSLILAAAANEVVSPNSSTPTALDPDYTQVANQPHTSGTAVTRTLVWVGSATATSTTAPSAQSTVWASTSSLAYWSISLQGIDVAPPSGFAVKTGLGAVASLTVLVGGTRVTPVSVGMIMHGFANVTAAVAKAGLTMGHRGASGTPNLPEMSERSYDYLLTRGYGLQEFSANRTSDGVWIGCHDADLNRTSQTAGLPNISTQTWATVQTFTNSLNSGGTPQPYYRFTDFLTKYVPLAVVMVDPKANLGNQTEFLDILDANGGPTRIIVKYYGVGSGSAALADAATARGYQTWGYFYEADYTSGDMATWQSHWSILGMEFAASAPAWTAVKSYGKKVIAHVVGSQANYALAISNGADIVQCSRPDLIAPVSVWT